MKPLAGLRVLELARVLAGPWAGQLLADLGATVIKVESPQGDDTRAWGPPFIAREEDNSAAYFYSCNRGKQSVIADLNDPEDRQLVMELAMEADVLIENFKVDKIKDYGLDYASLVKLNPGLVYCSITGFGQTGPRSKQAGYDYLIQGLSGLMSVTGGVDDEPQKVGVAITDIFTGVYACSAIQAALLARSKSKQGEYIDMSLLDVGTAIMANQASNFLASGVSPKRLGNQHPNIVPYQVFAARDGDIIIAVGNDKQFASLCKLLGHSEIAGRTEFSSNPQRVKHRENLIGLLAPLIANKTQIELLAGLEACGVPVAPINSMGEAFDDPQIQHRQLKISPENIDGVRSPISFMNLELSLDHSAPRLGEHSEQVRAQKWGVRAESQTSFDK